MSVNANGPCDSQLEPALNLNSRDRPSQGHCPALTQLMAGGQGWHLVVHELDVRPVDLLALVLRLLHLEHVLVEVLLQLLVGQVDAELLEVILLELLEPCRQPEQPIVAPPVLQRSSTNCMLMPRHSKPYDSREAQWPGCTTYACQPDPSRYPCPGLLQHVLPRVVITFRINGPQTSREMEAHRRCPAHRRAWLHWGPAQCWS